MFQEFSQKFQNTTELLRRDDLQRLPVAVDSFMMRSRYSPSNSKK